MSEAVALNLKLFNIPINAVASSGHQHLGSSLQNLLVNHRLQKPENTGVCTI